MTSANSAASIISINELCGEVKVFLRERHLRRQAQKRNSTHLTELAAHTRRRIVRRLRLMFALFQLLDSAGPIVFQQSR